MSGFQSPNFTQVPNDFFDEMLPELEKAELKVLLVIIRGTFGYHRDEVKISFREMAELTGLSDASIGPATKSLESMGLIEKVVDGNKTASWRAVVSVPTIGTRKQKGVPTIGTQAPQPLVHGVPTTETLSGLNKDKEKENKRGDLVDGFLAFSVGPGVKMALLKTDIESAIKTRLSMNPSGKDAESFIDYAAKQHKAGKEFPRFLDWWIANGGERKYWSFKRMEQMFPMAFETVNAEPQPDYMQNYFGS